jgi:hypothetical protein
MFVPPPPTSDTCRADVTRCAGPTAVSQASTRSRRDRPSPRSRPSTSARAIPSNSEPIDPDVSHTTAISGTGRRSAGSTTEGTAGARRDGRR